MLDRILVPLDGSEVLEEIIPSVRHLLSGTGALAHLLVVRPPVRDIVRTPSRVIYLDERLRDERAGWADYLTRKGSMLAYDGVVVRSEVCFGEPLAETLAAARRHCVRLIAVAAPAQSWLDRTLHPSLAQQLLAQSAVPVLAVPTDSPPGGRAVLRYGGAAV